MNKRISLLIIFAMLAMLVGLVSADHFNPQVIVNDQVSTDGTVTIAQVNSAAEGFLVVHADNGEGSFGAVIGHTPLHPGANYNVVVDIDTSMATSTLYAMLHEDTGEIGVYEFGEVDGADGPVAVDGDVVTPTFTAEIVDASDQMVDGSVMIDSVTVSQDGFVVIHAGDATSFGEVIGFAQVSEGTTTDVEVELMGEATSVIWPMLHVDTGEAGEYEFGEVDGADGPVAIDGAVATMPIWTTPHMRVGDQIVLHGDGMMMDDMEMAPSVTFDSILSDGPGFAVVHVATNADDGSLTFGQVIGVAPVADGLNEDVVVELDGTATPILFPMLHVDTGVEGEYEFGTVEGADSPVVVDGNVEVAAINAAPTITYSGTIDGNVVTVDGAVIDAPGWLVIHADDGSGAPGAVIGQAQIGTGMNINIAVTLDEDGMTSTLFPMLHYDTNEAGQYEFGEVDGADAPVAVNGNVVTAALVPQAME